eukprot:6173927-Pleurochrysis_carterae.AAC.1
MTVPTYMINGGNADNMGESNLLAMANAKKKRMEDAGKENASYTANSSMNGDNVDIMGESTVLGKASAKKKRTDQEDATAISGGGGRHEYMGLGGFDQPSYDGLGFGEYFNVPPGVVNGGNCNEYDCMSHAAEPAHAEPSEVGMEKSFGYGKDGNHNSNDENDNSNHDSGGGGSGKKGGGHGLGGGKSGESRGGSSSTYDDGFSANGGDDNSDSNQARMEEVRKKTRATTSIRPLNNGGGAGGDDKYRARPPKKNPVVVDGGLASNIGRAAAAMEGFTQIYKEQAEMDRAAAKEDAAATRALVKEELAQQKEIVQGCKQM